MSVSEASIFIKERALHVPLSDHARFIEMVETELLSLHEGNFARYRVSPPAFDRWKQAWSPG
jgi:hypothetical protein